MACVIRQDDALFRDGEVLWESNFSGTLLQGSTEDLAPAGFKKSGALKLFVPGRVWVRSESCDCAGPYET